MICSIPIVLRVCFQNLEVNRGSALLTIEVGTPCSLKIWCGSSSVVCTTFAVTEAGISQLNPTALSTTSRMESCPFSFVKGPMKSIV